MKEVFLHIEDMPKDCLSCSFRHLGDYPNLSCYAIGFRIDDGIDKRSAFCPLKCIEDPIQNPFKTKSVAGMELYNAEVIFERDIAACGYSYLTIYGKHVNGYFCCILNHKISCEMSEPCDTFYNFERLTAAGIEVMSAEIIANEIKKIAEAL